MAYHIILSDEAGLQLRDMTARQRSLILATINEQLTHQPDIETRNRKLLRPNPIAPWELRIGTIRVFYEIRPTSEEVWVEGIGTKVDNRVFLGGREVDFS